MHKLRRSVVFNSCSEIRSTLSEMLEEHVSEDSEYDIGYIEPSKQGVRGRTAWIFDESDVQDMYKWKRKLEKIKLFGVKVAQVQLFGEIMLAQYTANH